MDALKQSAVMGYRTTPSTGTEQTCPLPANFFPFFAIISARVHPLWKGVYLYCVYLKQEQKT